MRRRLLAYACAAVLLVAFAAPTGSQRSTAVATLPVLTGTVRIMIAGDSIAAGTGINCADGSSFGDRWAFGDWLAVNPGLSFVLVGSQASTCHAPYNHHEGHGGMTIGQLADNIAGYLNATPADVLILRVGVNDAKASGGYRSSAQMAADYTRLIVNARAQNPAIRILASEQVGPNGSLSAEFARASATIKQFNALLPSIVAPYLDGVHIGRNGLLTTLDLGDGLHPDVVGYLMIAWITINQPDGIWPWLSVDPPASTAAGALMVNPFA